MLEIRRPDAELITGWRAAIDAWESAATGATSSVTGGGAIRHLETSMSSRLGGRQVLGVGSGTAALAACLVGVGVRPGQEVITSALDWPAATQAILLIGAVPRFADVSPDTLAIDPVSASALLSDRTGAVVATHLFGIPADVPALRKRCGPGVPIVEDCAQAVGARLDGRETGTLAEAAAFSLGPGKQVDAGEGGLAGFSEEADWERAVTATQHPVRARVSTDQRPSTAVPSRIHPLAAVLALHQLQDVDRRTDNTRAAVRAWARQHPSASVLGLDARREPAWWRTPVTGAVETKGSSALDLRLPDQVSPLSHPHTIGALARVRLLDIRPATPPLECADSPAEEVRE